MHALSPEQTRAYLAHIDQPAPTLSDRTALDRLIKAHLDRVAFENVDVLLDRTIHIDTDAVFAKVVGRNRGGYCFEINGLFGRLLLALGFRVTPLAARVRWGLAADAPLTITSHLLLRVDFADEAVIADVGFGSANPTRSLPLRDGDGPGEWPFRLLAPDATHDDHRLETFLNDAWVPVYHFDLQPQHWVDYVPRNWYTSTHPDSIFRQMLVAARTEGAERLTLRNGTFNRRGADDQVTQRLLTDADEIIAVLREHFLLGITEDEAPRLRERLEGLLRG
ncbi:arylamine N-acetyltransferase family protein [Pseudomonas tohonis]|uniref:arylamine N-acetyltransferase family protein n=1 Tax=Pseudomonas tohonis TaxID=2725477 RepID=UPI00255BB48A|nr:arylamine N-acetyltransferase [Pseudomonas tohonis]